MRCSCCGPAHIPPTERCWRFPGTCWPGNCASVPTSKRTTRDQAGWATGSRPGRWAVMTRQERVTRVFVELADTLVVGFDVIDFLHTLVERSVELLSADAAGLMLADQKGRLEVVAASSEEARVLELFELQSSQGPCMDCFTTGEALLNLDPRQMAERWPLFAGAASVAGYRYAHA